MATSLAIEERWLEMSEASQIVGFWLLDAEGRTVQRADADGSIREMIMEFMHERIRQLSLSEGAAKPTLVSYPTQDE